MGWLVCLGKDVFLDGMGWDVMGWDGMGWERRGGDGMGWHWDEREVVVESLEMGWFVSKNRKSGKSKKPN